jgi:hypothetical protein
LARNRVLIDLCNGKTANAVLILNLGRSLGQITLRERN